MSKIDEIFGKVKRIDFNTQSSLDQLENTQEKLQNSMEKIMAVLRKLSSEVSNLAKSVQDLKETSRHPVVVRTEASTQCDFSVATTKQEVGTQTDQTQEPSSVQDSPSTCSNSEEDRNIPEDTPAKEEGVALGEERGTDEDRAEGSWSKVVSRRKRKKPARKFVIKGIPMTAPLPAIQESLKEVEATSVSRLESRRTPGKVFSHVVVECLKDWKMLSTTSVVAGHPVTIEEFRENTERQSRRPPQSSSYGRKKIQDKEVPNDIRGEFLKLFSRFLFQV